MSKHNAQFIQNYLISQKIKAQLKLENAVGLTLGLGGLTGVSLGCAIPSAIFASGGEAVFGGMAAVSGACTLASYLVMKNRKKKLNEIATMSEHSKKVVKDYERVEEAVALAKNTDTDKEDIVEKIEPLTAPYLGKRLREIADGQMVMNEF